MAKLGRALARASLLCLLLAPCATMARADWQDWPGARDTTSRAEVSQATLDKFGWELDYADGSGKVSFKDLAESGQPFVLVWWLSDCPVCHMQLPYVQKLQDQIEKNKLDVRIVSICIDQDTKDALKFVKQRGITFDVLTDPRARRTDPKYRVRDLGTPVTYVFKSGGELAEYLTGFKQQYSRAVLGDLGIPMPKE